MEPITRVAVVSHFLLMFGYKLFSFFFPLYLVQQGFSLPEVGYTYLLIYLPIALFAPFAGWCNTKFHPITLTLIGIGGYAAYSFAMMVKPAPAVFYVMQVVLGIAAACFFVSTRSLLMKSPLRHPDRAFGYFYAAPNVAEALAPALGALLIFLFGFSGVFFASLIIHTANIFFVLGKRSVARAVRSTPVSLPTLSAYKSFGRELRKGATLPMLLVSFTVLFVGGLYHPFFVIFLEHIGWSENLVLMYGAVFSVVFVPISYVVVRYALRKLSSNNVYAGSFIFALGSAVFGLLARRLEFAGILLLALVRGSGALMTNAGRSGHLSRSFPALSEPAGVLDTLLSPLANALGALLGGFLLLRLDFGALFTQAGVLVIAVTCLSLLLTRRNK